MVIRRTALWREGSSERLRVLIEDPNAEWFDEFARYRSAGLEVAVCTGPDAPGQKCPHLAGRGCDLWDEADIVVFALPRDEPAGRMVLKVGRREHPGKPIVYDLIQDAETDSPHQSTPARIAAILEEVRRQDAAVEP